MAAIQPIDGAFLINAFRQGRQDAVANAESRLKIQALEQSNAKDQQLSGLTAQLFGPSGGVSGQMMTPPTVSADGTAGAPGSPTVAPAATPAAPASGGQMNMDVFRRMATLDPKYTGELATTYKTMTDAQLKQEEAKNAMMGGAAYYVQQGKTPQDRQERFEHAIPELIGSGWSQQEIAQAEAQLAKSGWSDQILSGYQILGSGRDKIIEQVRESHKIVPIQAGGSALDYNTDTGTATPLIAPNPGDKTFGAPVGAPVRVQSLDEARKLPPGTHFLDPNGVERVVPGGGSGDAAGGFPNIGRYYGIQ